jgi:hypothetical protein
VRVCVCEWRGEFNRVVLVVQLGLIFHFILNPEQRRVFQLVQYKIQYTTNILEPKYEDNTEMHLRSNISDFHICSDQMLILFLGDGTM